MPKDTTTAEPTLYRVPITVEVTRLGATAMQAFLGTGRLALTRPRGRPIATRAAREMRNSFAALGPTYVKLGQIIASSPGVFPESLSNEFRTLLDRVPPADPALIRELIVQQLGDIPEEVFGSFDAAPFASASIAQVHHATLKSGERVVVKIQRPGIKLRLAADLQILHRLASVLEKSSYGRMLNAREVIEDFAANLREELDFVTEANSMEAWLASIIESPYVDRVRVPKVYWEHTTSRVLTMEHVQGVRVDNVEAITGAGHDGVRLIKSILFSLLESAFHGGLFHGDLHAGNVLVDDDGRIVFLDFGIVGRFDDATRIILRQLLGDLLVRNDFESVGRGLYALGAVRKPAGAAEAAKDIRTFTAPLISTNLSSLSYAKLGKQIADLAKIYDAKLPRELVLVGKQLLYVERYMKLLAPEWEAIGDPDLFSYVGGLLSEAEAERSATAAARSSEAVGKPTHDGPSPAL